LRYYLSDSLSGKRLFLSQLRPQIYRLIIAKQEDKYYFHLSVLFLRHIALKKVELHHYYQIQKNMFRTILFTLLATLFIFSSISCDNKNESLDKYYYLSDMEKGFLLYEEGDSILFTTETETISGFIKKKSSTISELERTGFSYFFYGETTEMWIYSHNEDKEIAYITLENNGITTVLSYRLNLTNLSLWNYEGRCEASKSLEFKAEISNDLLYEYTSTSDLEDELASTAANTFTFTTTHKCLEGIQKLEASSIDGFHSLIMNDGTTLTVEIY
jgi:hypothetical protein